MIRFDKYKSFRFIQRGNASLVENKCNRKKVPFPWQ